MIKRLLLFFVVTALLAAAQPCAASATLRFAPQPTLSLSLTEHSFRPFVQLLEDILQRPVELVLKRGYAEIIAALKNDQIDLAYLGPLPYVIASDSDPDLEPLLRFTEPEGSASYRCVLVVFGDTPATDLPNPSRVALTQPYSTCGYFMASQLLQQIGQKLDVCDYSYIGSHDGAALEVVRGHADLASIKDSVATDYAKLGLRVIAQSESLPGFLLVGNRRTLDKAGCSQLRQQLLKRQALPEGEPLQLIGRSLITAKADDYKVLRQQLHRQPVPGLCQ
ncbi:MAG: PhnD/SsuA/transferrin family substrate-binding protein [Desulfuromonas thiophila]|jgi:phosphonate transport system substrate-binding protein|nr:PhnD/SsuA/transferrin family substrate-binding protein [Desulfuromonas thiophila]